MEKIYLQDWQATMTYARSVGGGNKAVLFLHGLGCSSGDFREVMRSSALAGYNLIAPDLLGFGGSDRPRGFDYSVEHHAETIVELIDSLGYDRFAIVGHNMGGSVAVRLANLRADRVTGLVLAEPNLVEADSTYSKRFASYAEDQYIAAFPRLLRELSVKGGSDPDLASWVKTLQAAEPYAVYRSSVSLVRTTSDPSFKKGFTTIRLPRYYLLGEHSTPSPQLKSVEESGAVLRIIPGCGHGMTQTNPAAFAVTVRECLDDFDF